MFCLWKAGVLLWEAASSQQIPFHYTGWIPQARSYCMSSIIFSLMVLVCCQRYSEESGRQSDSTGVIWRLCGRVMQLHWMRWTAARSIHLIWLRSNRHGSDKTHTGSQWHLKLGTHLRSTKTVTPPYDNLFLLEICTEMDIHRILSC